MSQRQPSNFSWFVDNKVAGLAYPYSGDVTFLAEQGVKTLINLCEMPPGYAQEAEEHDVKVVSIPIVDFSPPSLQQIEQFLQIVSTASEAVAVHCEAGCGRTGTMLACYLVAVEGYSADVAIAETRQRRSGSIQLPKQIEAVHAFEKNLREKNVENV